MYVSRRTDSGPGLLVTVCEDDGEEILAARFLDDSEAYQAQWLLEHLLRRVEHPEEYK